MMHRQYLSVAVVAVVLSWAAAAQADDVYLFDNSGPNFYGSGTKIRGQHFSPSESVPTHIGVLDTFNTAGFHLDIPAGSTYTLELFPWVNDCATSTSQPRIAHVDNVAVTSDISGWVDLAFPDQAATGQYYLRITATSSLGWTLGGTTDGFNGGPNNQAFNDCNTPKNRDYWLHLGVTVNPCTIMPATTIDTVSGVYGRSGQSQTVTFTGTNLSSISSVNLVKSRDGGAPIIGTLAMSGSDLQVAFDLSAAEGGRYDIVARTPATRSRPSRRCTPRAFWSTWGR